MTKGIVVGLSFVVALGSVASTAGCRHKTNLPAANSVEADRYLFDHGNDALKRKHWLEGREYFKKLVDTYPQSPYRQDSKLGIGDSYLGENSIESNILAVNEFREFLSFFPGNARTDYAQYKIAVAYSHQMLGPDRDPTPARRSTPAAFRNYPTSAEPDVQVGARPRINCQADTWSACILSAGFDALDQFRTLRKPRVLGATPSSFHGRSITARRATKPCPTTRDPGIREEPGLEAHRGVPDRPTAALMCLCAGFELAARARLAQHARQPVVAVVVSRK